MASRRVQTAAAAIEPRLDIARLALALSGATETSIALHSALAALEECTAECSWVLLHRRAPDRYAAVVGRGVGQRELRQVSDEACRPGVWLSIDRVAPEATGLGSAVWLAAPPEAIEADGEPQLVIACWPPTGTDLQALRPQLATAARLVLAALRSAHSFERLLDQTARDPLTGLLNRRGVLDALARETARARRAGGPISVLFLDLDGFKDVNDRHGHVAGDQLLAAVGARLGRLLRGSDALGRLGGDEFLVVLGDADLDAAWRVGRRLAEGLRGRPLWCSAGPLWLGLTFGAASQEEHLAGEALIALADRRMLERKRVGQRPTPPSAGENQPSSQLATR